MIYLFESILLLLFYIMYQKVFIDIINSYLLNLSIITIKIIF